MEFESSILDITYGFFKVLLIRDAATVSRIVERKTFFIMIGPDAARFPG